MQKPLPLIALTLLAVACAATPAPPAPEPSPLVLVAAVDDPARNEIEADLVSARETIEGFFGLPFAGPVTVTLAANRKEFDAVFPAEWGMGETQCWMVGTAVADWFALLTPAAWADQACEHDAGDAGHVQELVTHELVHAFHGQHNPTRDFTGMDDIGWFVEGLAVYVAGQLDDPRRAGAADAIANGAAPAELEAAWSGKYRYGVSGSLVAYIDQTFGRETLVNLLGATTEAEILGRLGTSEDALLADWAAWVTASGG